MSSIGVPERAALFGDCTRTTTGLKPNFRIDFPRAAGHAFQKINDSTAEDKGPVTLSSTTIVKYAGIEKRDGLVSVAKRLLEGGGTLNPWIPSLICH